MNTACETLDGPLLVAQVDAASSSFDADLGTLLGDLKRWRIECAAEPPAPDDFPPLDVRAFCQGAGLLAVHFILEALAFPSGHPAVNNSLAWLAVVIGTLLLSLGSGAFLVSVKAHGMHQRRYWRAAWHSFNENDQFPFEQMRSMLDRDLHAARRLEPYSLAILQTGRDRFSMMEETLRARLTTFFGNPSLLVLSGLLGAIWTAWEKYSAGGGTFNLLLLAGSIGLFLLGLYGAKLQISLADLTRCRALLSLEIARRMAGA